MPSYPQSPLMGQMVNQLLLFSSMIEFSTRRLAHTLQALVAAMVERAPAPAWIGLRQGEACRTMPGSGALPHNIHPRLRPHADHRSQQGRHPIRQ